MIQYDLIVIGGGPAGYHAAENAAANGLKVAIFEEKSIGGVCLNEGCIPTKSMLYSAKIYEQACKGDLYGITLIEASLDHKAVIKRKNKVVKKLVGGVKAKLASAGSEGAGVVPNHEEMQKTGSVDVITHRAEMQKNEAGDIVVLSDDKDYCAANIFIATGSNSIIPPITGVNEGIDAGYVLTSREILDIDEVPEKLVIIGGGGIGLEMANYFAVAGASVTVVEMLDKIAGNFDDDVSTVLLANLKKKGIDFRLGTTAASMSENVLTVIKDGEPEEISFDKLLLSIGRKPNIMDIGIENLGLEISKQGIVVNEKMQTNNPSVYAIGDVNGKSMLAHTAYREAEVAVNQILGIDDVMSYRDIPSNIYTTPEVAGVGETEKTAEAKGLDFKAVSLPMNYAGRYVAENERGDGICKFIVEVDTNKLLGAHMIGSYSSEIIIVAVMMIESGESLLAFKKTVFPHPTVGEIIKEIIYSL